MKLTNCMALDAIKMAGKFLISVKVTTHLCSTFNQLVPFINPSNILAKPKSAASHFWLVLNKLGIQNTLAHRPSNGKPKIYHKMNVQIKRIS